MELRDSSRVLGDLVEFALKRLQSLSSSTVKHAGRKAIELAMSTVPFTDIVLLSGRTAAEGVDVGGVRRTVTKVVSSSGTSGGSSSRSSGSSRNAELVMSFEQELSLLDEVGVGSDGADVGERMDHVSSLVNCGYIYI